MLLQHSSTPPRAAHCPHPRPPPTYPMPPSRIRCTGPGDAATACTPPPTWLAHIGSLHTPPPPTLTTPHPCTVSFCSCLGTTLWAVDFLCADIRLSMQTHFGPHTSALPLPHTLPHAPSPPALPPSAIVPRTGFLAFPYTWLMPLPRTPPLPHLPHLPHPPF